MKNLIFFRAPSKHGVYLMLALAAFLPQISRSAPPTATAPVTKQPTAMKTFVIIFHQGPTPLTDADKQRRAEETSAWARHQNDVGHHLDPRILAPESAHRGAEEPNRADTWPLTALLFLEARDLNDATQVAEAHPALRYGAHVEVRPWTVPIPATPPTAP